MTTFKDLLSQENLGKIKAIGKENATPKPTAPKIAQKVSEPKSDTADDSALFSKAMAGVKPLKSVQAPISQSPKKDPNAIFRRASAVGTESTPDTPISDMQALLNPVAGEAFLSFKEPTLPNKVFENLKTGKLRWYLAVDLHGLTVEDARQAVLELIAYAYANGDTVVKITHGKGENALLKTCVNGWLRQLPSVLAFVSAPNKDGGTGAVLVLLKKDKAFNELNDNPYLKDFR